MEQERVLGQKFVVDATLEADLSAAGASDALCDTVNYASVYTLIRGILEGPPAALLESVASRICGAVLGAEPRVARVTVRLSKPHVAVAGPVASLGIEISRERSGSLLGSY